MRPDSLRAHTANQEEPLLLNRRDWGRAVVLGGSALFTGNVMAQTEAATSSIAASSALPKARFLREELTNALGKGRPLVVMVSLIGCPYCKVARENYLLPLVRQDAISVVQVDMLTKDIVQDFHGNTLTHEQLVERWRVRIAPTLLFFGKSGIEKAERLVGGYLPDFYGAYLQERLSTAQKFL